MLKKFLIASAAGLLLAASSPQAAPPPQAYTVYFDTGQSVLSPEATATVAQAADAFKQGGTAVGVRGHADTVGDPEMNLQLSLQRAAAVKDALQRNGVPAAAILSGGVGEQNLPIATADQVPERLNRSVDIAISTRELRSIMSDKDYCAALAKKWREYSRTDASTQAPHAIAKCEAGDYPAGITTLERILSNDKVLLPSRYL